MTDPREMPSAQRLVDALRQRGDLRDARLQAAFLNIPREAFLPGVPLEQVYSDEAIAIKRDPDGSVISSSSQPSMMALMIEQMRLSPGMNVLEIGAGTGYNAAIMADMLGRRGRVTSIEFDPVIAAQAQDNLQRAAIGETVMVVTGDGAGGFAPRAAYDRIIATAGAWDVPRAWVRQLKPRGLIVVPLWLEGFQYSAALQLQPDGSLYSERNLPCGFVRMRGLASGPPVEMRLASGSMAVFTSGASAIDPTIINMLASDISDGYVGFPISAREWASSAMPFLLLNLGRPFWPGSYYVAEGRQAYGLEGSGFCVISRASACFIPAYGDGQVQVFGAADALLAVQDVLAQWERAGKPTLDRLRIRLTALEGAQAPRPPPYGAVFARSDHHIEFWFA